MKLKETLQIMTVSKWHRTAEGGSAVENDKAAPGHRAARVRGRHAASGRAVREVVNEKETMGPNPGRGSGDREKTTNSKGVTEAGPARSGKHMVGKGKKLKMTTKFLRQGPGPSTGGGQVRVSTLDGPRSRSQ